MPDVNPLKLGVYLPNKELPPPQPFFLPPKANSGANGKNPGNLNIGVGVVVTVSVGVVVVVDVVEGVVVAVNVVEGVVVNVNEGVVVGVVNVNEGVVDLVPEIV